MFRDEYGEAAIEVLDILDNTDKNAVAKIPTEFIQFLVNNASENYTVNFDHSKTINELNLLEETKEILGTIYINWWCSEEDRKKYKKEIEELEQQKQEELRKKYDPNDIFKQKGINKATENVEKLNKQFPIVKKENSIFTRFINKIKSIFKYKK